MWILSDDILTAVTVWLTVYWIVILCSVIVMSQCCRRTFCFFFDVTTCNMVDIYWCFRRICFFFFWDMMLWSLVYIHWHIIGISIIYTDNGHSRFVQGGQCQSNSRCLIPEHSCLILNISVNMHHSLTGSNFCNDHGDILINHRY